MTWHYIFTKSPARSNNINDLRPTEGPSLLKISMTYFCFLNVRFNIINC